METNRQLDPTRGARPGTLGLIAAVLLASGCLHAQDADAAYRSGLELAQQGRWDEARAALLRGRQLRPDDSRFPIELGGVAFRQKRYREAVAWLRRGLRLNPKDTYAADFLGTIYFLRGNLDAALLYWNRIGKPQIAQVQTPPELRVDRVLLDWSFAFAQGGTLRLKDLTASRARVNGLGIFHTFHFDLKAREDGKFDVAFSGWERNGWGRNTAQALVSTLSGVAYQTITPAYFNVGGAAINVTSLVRWDRQKRRLAAGVSGPLHSNPRYRYEAGIDVRDENWDLRHSFAGPAPSLGELTLRRVAASASVTSFPSGVWTWVVGGEFSRREYRGIAAGPGLPADALLSGWQLKGIAQVERELWRVPDRRLDSRASLSSETGRMWAERPRVFEKLQAAVNTRWLPRMSGDDYAISQQFRAGKIIGGAPFDELYMLGLERDNDIWMRAHIGTRDGRKGSAPLGRSYFVSNWEMDKNIYSGLVGVKLSPFVDSGKSWGFATSPGKWLWDTGVQAKVRVLGVGFVVVYGKDLRSGNNAFYLMAGRGLPPITRPGTAAGPG